VPVHAIVPSQKGQHWSTGKNISRTFPSKSKSRNTHILRVGEYGCRSWSVGGSTGGFGSTSRRWWVAGWAGWRYKEMRKCQLCMRAFKARARRSAVQRARRGRWSGDMDMFVDDEERKERSREIHGLCCFLLLFIVFFILSTLILYLRNTKRFKITSQQHLHTLISRFSPTSGSISSNFKNRAIFVAMASRPYSDLRKYCTPLDRHETHHPLGHFSKFKNWPVA